MAGSGNTVTH